MQYRQFEREFLRLAFTTDIELTPSSLAFITGITVREATEHLNALVSAGVLELASDDDGRISYDMPDRPDEPMSIDDPALVGLQDVSVELLAPGQVTPNGEHVAPPQAMVVRRLRPLMWDPPPVSSGQAVASMFLNALVCPGVGSLVGGRTGAGMAQLSLFLLGLPLAFIAVGVPLMLAAWVWGIATGAQLISEARDA
jgi:TM2 domain-containing membrane protein YozV